jgi:hypothetical protein
LIEAKKEKVQIGQINRDQAAEKPGLKFKYCAPASPRPSGELNYGWRKLAAQRSSCREIPDFVAAVDEALGEKFSSPEFQKVQKDANERISRRLRPRAADRRRMQEYKGVMPVERSKGLDEGSG